MYVVFDKKFNVPTFQNNCYAVICLLFFFEEPK